MVRRLGSGDPGLFGGIRYRLRLFLVVAAVVCLVGGCVAFATTAVGYGVLGIALSAYTARLAWVINHRRSRRIVGTLRSHFGR